LLLLSCCAQCLFRSNGSAVLLSNKAADSKRAKYHIRNIVRTNMAADDVAYNCVMQVRTDYSIALRSATTAWYLHPASMTLRCMSVCILLSQLGQTSTSLDVALR
jgi:hypothetical protein